MLHITLFMLGLPTLPNLRKSVGWLNLQKYMALSRILFGVPVVLKMHLVFCQIYQQIKLVENLNNICTQFWVANINGIKKKKNEMYFKSTCTLRCQVDNSASLGALANCFFSNSRTMMVCCSAGLLDNFAAYDMAIL